MKKELEKIFCELIQKSLNLPDNYGIDKRGNVIPCVTIRAQNIKLFNTPKLQITIAILSNQVFSNRKKEETIINEQGQTQYIERININEQDLIQIDIYSRDNSARQRYREVQACLTSTLAEQLQDKYQFRIGTISRAQNLSGLDGGSEINRYTIRFNCLSWYEKVTPIDYYDKFEVTAETESGLIADIKNYTDTNIQP